MKSAIALISSGLDSILAARIVSDQGIKVRGILFYFIFDNLYYKIKNGEIDKILQPLEIPVEKVDLTDKMVNLLQTDPEHGFGSEMNPCIDCHIMMLKTAHRFMKKIRADFLITGEVVGQRAMSQKEPILRHIDKLTDLGGLILRPLSAKLLEETLPERRGWIDREKLYGIAGRSRKKQLELAERLGIKKFGTPAGGCILTDPEFAKRLIIFRERKGRKNVSKEELILMRYGRHFWPRNNLHIIAGRNESENEILETFADQRWVFQPVNVPGPLILATDIKDREDMLLAGGIISRYCTKKKSAEVKIKYENTEKGISGVFDALPVGKEELEEWRV